jgi:DNA invertase Pin-like site-specific DNA recombinase
MSQRVEIYTRVSTLHSENPEMQLAELRVYAARRGWKVTAEYVDLGRKRVQGASRELGIAACVMPPKVRTTLG